MGQLTSFFPSFPPSLCQSVAHVFSLCILDCDWLVIITPKLPVVTSVKWLFLSLTIWQMSCPPLTPHPCTTVQTSCRIWKGHQRLVRAFTVTEVTKPTALASGSLKAKANHSSKTPWFCMKLHLECTGSASLVYITINPSTVALHKGHQSVWECLCYSDITAVWSRPSKVPLFHLDGLCFCLWMPGRFLIGPSKSLFLALKRRRDFTSVQRATSGVLLTSWFRFTNTGQFSRVMSEINNGPAN